MIGKIDKEGSLYKAGLRNMDKVISINGKPVSSMNEFMDILVKYPIGETVEVEYKKRHSTQVKVIQMELLGPPVSGSDEKRAIKGNGVRASL